MTLHSFILTDHNGREARYDRYVKSTSLADRFQAEDSAIRAFQAATGRNPVSVVRV